MATKTTSRVLVSAAVSALALGLTAPAASAHDGGKDGLHDHARQGGHHRGHGWGHASLKASRVVVSEGAGTATVTLRLSKKAPKDASFTWSTSDKVAPAGRAGAAARHSGSARSGHLALAGSDYTASTGTVTIAAGTRKATVTVPITDDGAAEKAEAFAVKFKATPSTVAAARRAAHREGAAKGWCAGAHGRTTATVIITDND